MLKKIVNQNELFLFVILCIICTVFAIINPAFLSLSNFLNITKNSIEIGIFAIGVLLVLISGGIDVSFMAISVFAMYSTTRMALHFNPEINIIVIFLVSALIGLLLGLFNAWVISRFKLPTFIVTLGTSNIYTGCLLAFVGTNHISSLPKSMHNFSLANIYTYTTADGSNYGLHIATFLFVAIAVLTSFILRYTTLGRNIYAVGGDRISAKRVGINIKNVQIFVYGFVGIAAGLTGIVHASLLRIANPFDMVGNELNVIAATVLGGASIFGGKGTVLGTILGVFIIVVINSSLILLGISSYWQKIVVGIIVVLSVTIQAIRQKKH